MIRIIKISLYISYITTLYLQIVSDTFRPHTGTGTCGHDPMMPLIAPPPFLSSIYFSCTHFATFYVSLYDIYTINTTKHRRMGHGFRFLPPFSLLSPLFQKFHNHSPFFKIFIIIRFSSFDYISRRHTS